MDALTAPPPVPLGDHPVQGDDRPDWPRAKLRKAILIYQAGYRCMSFATFIEQLCCEPRGGPRWAAKAYGWTLPNTKRDATFGDWPMTNNTIYLCNSDLSRLATLCQEEAARHPVEEDVYLALSMWLVSHMDPDKPINHEAA